MAEANGNGNGDIIKLKMGTLRNMALIMAIIGSIVTGTYGFFEIKRTAEETRTLLQQHIEESRSFLDKNVFDISIKSLEKQVDDLSKEVKGINQKLDAYILRGK